MSQSLYEYDDKVHLLEQLCVPDFQLETNVLVGLSEMGSVNSDHHLYNRTCQNQNSPFLFLKLRKYKILYKDSWLKGKVKHRFMLHMKWNKT